MGTKLCDILKNEMNRLREAVEWGNRLANADPSPERREVVEMVAQHDHWRSETDEMPERLADLIAWLAECMTRVPAEYHDSAVIEFDSEYESSSIDWSISYKRPETDEEMTARLADAAEVLSRKAEMERAAELELLAALKAKYGDTPD